MFREGRTTEHVKHRVDRFYFFSHPREKVGPLFKIEIQIKFLISNTEQLFLPGVKKKNRATLELAEGPVLPVNIRGLSGQHLTMQKFNRPCSANWHFHTAFCKRHKHRNLQNTYLPHFATFQLLSTSFCKFPIIKLLSRVG